MNKLYTALGLMSGTSGDGVDASIIKSDGISSLEVIFDNFFEYDISIYDNIHKLKDKINNRKNIIEFEEDLKSLEREITLFHAKVVKKILENRKVDLIGFHGQTIYHNSKEKISKQLGDAKLLFQLIKKKIVYNFRENDIKNNGNGAPLAPVYHAALAKKIKKNNTVFLNIGGISNETFIDQNYNFSAKDLGPGNCLSDLWIRQKTKNIFDESGNIARSGKINKILLDQSLDNYFNNKISNKRSYDINDFDISSFRGLTLEDGAATIIEFTKEILANKISSKNIICCGGVRKNKFLIEILEKKIEKKIINIDDFKIDGDFIESQAFAYLAIRSFLNLTISFPSTTGCSNESQGGTII